MIQFGNDKIKDIYVGSDKIKEVYYGSEKVWGEIESILVGYWVHKDTGVKTYFGPDDYTPYNGIMTSPPWRYDCSEVNIPEGVISLGSFCFQNCTSLTSITLPESLTRLELACFYDCESLTLATVLPAIPPSLGGYVFDGVHTSFNIKVRSPYVNDYKTATNWISYASIITAI